MTTRLIAVGILFLTVCCSGRQNQYDSSEKTLTGKAAFGGIDDSRPGIRRKITAADLPEPYLTPSVDNGPKVARRPEGAVPLALPGFKVNLFTDELDNPRKIVTAPNGDAFVAESGPNRIRVLRDTNGDGKADVKEIYASGLDQPFGLAFYPSGPNPRYLYVGNTGSVVRFAYHNGDLKAQSAPEMIVPDIPSGGRLRGGGHWTRDVAFSKDGKRMLVSVGSLTNVWEGERGNEDRRADILSYTPEGKDYKLYASGIRNAVGIAVNPRTGDLWGSVNERDGLGDNVPSDYVTRIREGGFYGWPWYYIGSHEDPRHKGSHPELRDKVTVPDVLIQAHSASLCMTFYNGTQFPREYFGDAFAAEHGSWNRSNPTGYKVIRIILHNGIPTGEYEDFATGFATPDRVVWGRPVGVTVAKDGSLLVSEDGNGTIWRFAYEGKK